MSLSEAALRDSRRPASRPWNEVRVVDAVDAVVLATAREPVDTLYTALEGEVPYVYIVGDAWAPRFLREATYEAHRFARVIGEADMPKSVSEEAFKPMSAARPAAFA